MLITKVRIESFGLVTERSHDTGVLCAVSHIFAHWTSPVSVTHRQVWYRALSLCYACIRLLGTILTP